MWLRPIRLYRVHNPCCRNWNQRAVIECALQRSRGHGDNQAADLSWRLNSFSPLPFNAAMDAQRIYRAHWVNLADAPQRENGSSTDGVLPVDEVAETWKVPSEVAKWLVKLPES